MLPGIAHVDIEIDGDYQATVIVVYTAPMRLPLHPRNDLSSRPPAQVPQTGDWVTLIQVIENMHERVVFRNLDNRPVRHHLFHGGLKYGPGIFAVEIIHQ